MTDLITQLERMANHRDWLADQSISQNAAAHLRRYTEFLCSGTCSDLRNVGDENGEGIRIDFQKTLAEYKAWLAEIPEPKD